MPADSVYGVAFTINYSKEVVDSNSAHISHAQCWMGTPNINLLTLQHDNYSNGKIDCAIVGTDHLNKQGFGTVGVLGIDMKDDLSGRDSLIKTLNLSFSNLRFIDSDRTEKPLNVIYDSIICGKILPSFKSIRCNTILIQFIRILLPILLHSTLAN